MPSLPHFLPHRRAVKALTLMAVPEKDERTDGRPDGSVFVITRKLALVFVPAAAAAARERTSERCRSQKVCGGSVVV